MFYIEEKINSSPKIIVVENQKISVVCFQKQNIVTTEIGNEPTF